MLQVFDTHPIPIEIFAPDGTAIYTNRANMEMMGCMDASLLVGKYNLKNDPVCLELLGQGLIDRVFRGETVVFPDFPAPIQDVLDRGVIDEKPWKAATMDLYAQPVFEDGEFICTICYFIVKNTYQGREEMVKAQQYIKKNWLEPFNIGNLAKEANLSVHHFNRLFKKYMGMSPYNFYKKTKIEKIQEHLCDPNLTITQAFAECGTDSTGTFFREFKKVVHMTPSEYREQNRSK
jgi:AraC-like DNA-binding protein